MFKEEKRKKSFLSGLIAGGFIGGLAGLLFAPKSGRELRSDISDKGNEILNDTTDLLENAKSKAAGIFTDVKHKAGNLIDAGITKAGIITHDAEELINSGKEKIEEEFSKVKDAVRSGADAYTNERNKMKSVSSKNHSDNRSKDSKEDKSYYNKSGF